MNSYRTFLFQITPILKLFILILFCIFMPIYYGIPLFLLLTYLYYKLINKLLGLNPLTSTDKLFLNNNLCEDYLGISFLEVTKGKQDEMVKFFIEKPFKHLQKWRSILQFKFGEYWWKPIQFKDAVKKLKITYDSNTIVSNQKDLAEYSNKELKNHLDIENSEFPYEIIVFKHKDSSFSRI